MKRQIALDTETTGLRHEDGHRIVEIGAVEIIDRKVIVDGVEIIEKIKTGKTFHFVINPERDIPVEVVRIHGIDNERVKDAPKFKDIVGDFVEFIKGSEVIMHNAKFDIGFLNSELERVNKGKIWEYVEKVTCSLDLDKRLYDTERKHSLDAICIRFNIDTSARVFHGALLDSDLLADVFIETNKRFPRDIVEADLEQTNWERPPIKRLSYNVQKIKPTLEEESSNAVYLDALALKEKLVPIFLKNSLIHKP